MSVPENRRGECRLEVFVKARELCVHTLRIVGNRNVFSPYVTRALPDGTRAEDYNPAFDMLAQQLCEHALGISRDVWSANNVLVRKDADGRPRRDDWAERSALQARAARRCNDLLADMQVAVRAYHLRAGKVEHWAAMTVEVRDLIRRWRESDAKRYGV